jgi:signal peptidase I
MKKFVDSLVDFINEWSINILILLFGTTTLVQAFIVPTPSMESTVLVGDHLLVDKLSYAPAGSITRYVLPYTDPKRGDVIVFRYPMDIQQNYVKRLMGVPGDRIHLVDKVVYLNGHALTEPYTQHCPPVCAPGMSAGIDPYRDNFPTEPQGPVYDRARQMLAENVVNGELVVPPGFYFAMGDNRDNSLDSRYWGFVPRENIIGKPLVIFWSYAAPTEDLVDYNMTHFIDLAEHFFTRTRWDRTLKLVRGYPVQ